MPTEAAFDFAPAQISIVEVSRGLRAAQHGREYLARDWRLTPGVRTVLNTAVEFGLTHLWQDNHPIGAESHHISFSFSHDRESWVFVIGAEAKPPRLLWITFNKSSRAISRAVDLWSQEELESGRTQAGRTLRFGRNSSAQL